MRHYTLPEAILYGHGTERPFLCPVHGDSRPSASVNIIKKKWVCYTCGAHGGLTGEYALIEPDAEQMKIWFASKLEESRVYPESWLDRWDAVGVHPYWKKRVGERAAVHFRLGYDPDTESVTYPLRGPAGVLGVVRRALHREEGQPKYRYPRGIDVGRLLFNYSPECRRSVVLVEGALDAIALWNVGVPALAIYGSRLSVDQVALIDKIDPEVVYTAYDNDDAGFKAHCDTERAFKHRLVDRITWPRSWGKDVDEIGPERLRKIVSSLVSADLSCVESQSCGSYETPQQSKKISVPSTWRRRKLRIVPTPA
jgi:hypothetical protein